jgi:DNA-binding transcriptional LysR family regulator
MQRGVTKSGRTMTIDDLNDLYLFARVVEAAGFAAAERETGIPKSRLSRRIAALEKQLGVRLIHRSAHTFNVTDVGLSVYKHARAMADEAQSAIATVADSLNEPSGLVRMSSSILTAELYLAGWLGEFMSRYPKVRVSLELSNRFVDLLAERIDVAIRFSTEPLPSAELIARPLGISRMVLVASPGLLERYGTPVDIRDLGKLPALGQGTLEAVRPWSFKGPDGSVILHHPEPRLVVENIIALREAAIHGAGAIQLPWDVCRKSIELGELRLVLEQYPSIGTGVYCLYPSRVGMPAAVRVLLNFLEERFRSIY